MMVFVRQFPSNNPLTNTIGIVHVACLFALRGISGDSPYVMGKRNKNCHLQSSREQEEEQRQACLSSFVLLRWSIEHRMPNWEMESFCPKCDATSYLYIFSWFESFQMWRLIAGYKNRSHCRNPVHSGRKIQSVIHPYPTKLQDQNSLKVAQYVAGAEVDM